jgi:CheY-like chemotaxis protein
MRLLLVDDNDGIRKLHSDFISSLNKDIDVIEATSFEDLKLKILSADFDTAIVDMNLSKWGTASWTGISNGMEICELLQSIKNFQDPLSCLVLYSAQTDINVGPIQPDYTILDKDKTEGVLERFISRIIGPMMNKVETNPAPSLEEFSRYAPSRQVQYYKRILHKDKGQARFATSLTDNCMWASDIKGERDAEIVSYFEEDEHNVQTIAQKHYQELDFYIEEHQRVPAVFWNHATPERLAIQKECIRDVWFRNDFLSLFHTISFSQAIAARLTDVAPGSMKYVDLIKLLGPRDAFLLNQTQCGIIDIMVNREEKEDKILQKLAQVTQATGFEIVDYFDAILDSFDAESDVAHVGLISRINPGRYYKKEFSYKRLKDNGVKYRNTSFRYCVSSFKSNLGLYVEPV